MHGQQYEEQKKKNQLELFTYNMDTNAYLEIKKYLGFEENGHKNFF